jgi:glycosyltransferase involved in cell wall biosynthesis
VGEVLHNIFKYDFWDIDALANQIIGIATSPSLTYELKKNTAQEYARISWHNVAAQCIDLYSRVKQGATV